MARGKDETLGALDARVKTLEREIPEVKADVKATLAIVTRMDKDLATGPKPDEVKALDARVRTLEDDKNKATGGFKALVTVGSLIGAILGWVSSHFFK